MTILWHSLKRTAAVGWNSGAVCSILSFLSVFFLISDSVFSMVVDSLGFFKAKWVRLCVVYSLESRLYAIWVYSLVFVGWLCQPATKEEAHHCWPHLGGQWCHFGSNRINETWWVPLDNVLQCLVCNNGGLVDSHSAYVWLLLLINLCFMLLKALK